MSADEMHLDDLLGAYALDAVSDEERRLVEQYLLVNPRARQEVEEHREVATMLAWTSMAAPDGVWDRIAASIDDEVAPTPSGMLADVMAPSAPQQRAEVTRLDDVRARRSKLRSMGSWALASAAAAVIAVVAVTVFDPQRTQPPPLSAAVDAARADRDSVVVDLVREDGLVGGEAIIDQEGHGFLIGSELPRLPDSQTYQIWGVIGEQVISLGVIGNSPEVALFPSTDGLSAVVLTIEPAGGVVSNGNGEGAFVGALPSA
jgi:anti-sigma-K factor RskA